MRDATLEFRLSVYNAKPADEGLYTCTTPKNLVMMMVMYEDEGLYICTTPKNMVMSITTMIICMIQKMKASIV